MAALPRAFNLDILGAYLKTAVPDASGLDSLIFRPVAQNLYSVDQFMLEGIFFNYFSRTDEIDLPNIDGEDVIYIPAFLGLLSIEQGNDRDTVFAFVQRINEFAGESPDTLHVLPLSKIFRAFSSWPYDLTFRDNIVIVSIENFFPHQNVITAPYPSNYYYEPGELAERLAQKRARPKRNVACFFGRQRASGHIRSQYIERLQGARLAEVVSEFGSGTRKHLLDDGVASGLDDLRSRSLMSIELPGDSPSRKGIYDALLNPCVPMLFESGRFDFPFRNGFPWMKTCIFVTATDEWRILNDRRSMDDILGQYDLTLIEEKLDAIADHAHLLQYTPAALQRPGTQDAFWATMQEVAALARSKRAYGWTGMADPA